MPKAFSDYEKKIIQERLLKEGEKQFSTYGLKKTNIEELAQAAGISKGAFYLFYESKESLFMDVTEQAERRFRRELLAMIDQPGPTPRARLAALFKKAFDLVDTIPVLKFLTGGDFDVLFRRVPPEKLQEHFNNDRIFFEELIARCREADIPIQVQSEEIAGLLYPLVLTILHKENIGPDGFSGNFDLLLELIAAYCLGEVQQEATKQALAAPDAQSRGGSHESDH